MGMRFGRHFVVARSFARVLGTLRADRLVPRPARLRGGLSHGCGVRASLAAARRGEMIVIVEHRSVIGEEDVSIPRDRLRWESRCSIKFHALRPFLRVGRAALLQTLCPWARSRAGPPPTAEYGWLDSTSLGGAVCTWNVLEYMSE
ncbi:hypothetical protein Efla_001105 [Eimeria flavescens]